MVTDEGLEQAVKFFKTLGSSPRLQLLLLIGAKEQTVGALSEATGLSQPLVSQHLRTLRENGLVIASRLGKEVRYRLDDQHVAHVIEDALSHVGEDHTSDEESRHIHEGKHNHG